MERSDRLIKIISVIVFVALLVYGGFSLYIFRGSSLETVAATEMELRTSVDTFGWAVREESILTSAETGVVVTVNEGERVAAELPIAVTYSSNADLSRAESIRELAITISALERVAPKTDAAGAAKASLLELSRVISSRDLTSLAAAELDINAYVMNTASGSEGGRVDIEGMRTRMASLMGSLETGTVIRAPGAGIYSRQVDGYETVGAADVTGSLLPSQLDALFTSSHITPSHNFGKLVYGIRWYYVTIMDYNWATLLKGKGSVDVEFSKTFSGVVTMQVESVGQEEDGRAVVVLSASKHLAEVTGLRELSGEVIFQSSSGIRVPRGAVHLNEKGETIVYILTGLQAQSVNVTILGEDGDWYMVAAGGALRVGNRVITRADNLADGSVVLRR